MKSKNIAYWITTILVAFPIEAAASCRCSASRPQSRASCTSSTTRPTSSPSSAFGSPRRHRHPHPAFPATQGVGLCRHHLRSEQRRRFHRRGRRIRCLRLPHPRPAHHCWSGHGLLVSPPAQPQNRQPHSNPQRRAITKSKPPPSTSSGKGSALLYRSAAL